MSRTLRVADGREHVVSTTTTIKLAERMLASLRVVACSMPAGLHPPSPVSILLELYLAEEEALYPRASRLGRTDHMHPMVVDRWIAVLVQQGLVEQQQGRNALTEAGHEHVIGDPDAALPGSTCLGLTKQFEFIEPRDRGCDMGGYRLIAAVCLDKSCFEQLLEVSQIGGRLLGHGYAASRRWRYSGVKSHALRRASISGIKSSPRCNMIISSPRSFCSTRLVWTVVMPMQSPISCWVSGIRHLPASTNPTLYARACSSHRRWAIA